MTLAFPYHSANEYINTEDNSSSLDKSGYDGGTQWTCTETSFVGKKSGSATKKKDHCKLKKKKGPWIGFKFSTW